MNGGVKHNYCSNSINYFVAVLACKVRLRVKPQQWCKLCRVWGLTLWIFIWKAEGEGGFPLLCHVPLPLMKLSRIDADQSRSKESVQSRQQTSFINQTLLGIKFSPNPKFSCDILGMPMLFREQTHHLTERPSLIKLKIWYSHTDVSPQILENQQPHQASAMQRQFTLILHLSSEQRHCTCLGSPPVVLNMGLLSGVQFAHWGETFLFLYFYFFILVCAD